MFLFPTKAVPKMPLSMVLDRSTILFRRNERVECVALRRVFLSEWVWDSFVSVVSTPIGMSKQNASNDSVVLQKIGSRSLE